MSALSDLELGSSNDRSFDTRFSFFFGTFSGIATARVLCHFIWTMDVDCTSRSSRSHNDTREQRQGGGTFSVDSVRCTRITCKTFDSIV